MIFRQDITVPLGFAPVNIDMRIVGGAVFSEGMTAELDLRNAQSPNLTVGAANSGWAKVVVPSVLGTRGAVPQCITLEAIAYGAKGKVRLSGVVRVAATGITKGDLLTYDDTTDGRRIYGIALGDTSDGFVDVLWDGEDGLGQFVNPGTPGNDPPVANITATPNHGTKPLSVTLDATGSTDDGVIINYEFNYGEGDGWVDNDNEPTIVHVYQYAGTYTAAVRVTDNGSPALQDIDTCQIVVSNPDGTGIDGSAGGADDNNSSGGTQHPILVVVPF